MQGAQPTGESHIGGILALILLGIGAAIAYLLTPILSALLGLLTLYIGWKFLKWRVDPMDMFYWMKSKPSWAAVGLTFLCGLLLFGISYLVYAYVNDHSWVGPYLSSRV